MEITVSRPVDTGKMPPARRRSKRATRPQLLTRASLDSRTNAAKAFDRLAAAIEADLGGREQCSAIQLALIEAFCGSAVTLDALNAKLALGLPVDVSQHSQCVGAMVRVASRLGLQRVPKPVQSLQDYLASLKDTTINSETVVDHHDATADGADQLDGDGS